MNIDRCRTDADLVEGRLVQRRNRFVLDVALGGEVGGTADGPAGSEKRVEEVYLPETGRLTTVLVDDATVVCEPVEDPDRRTDFTALAVHNGDVYVTVEAVRANAMVAEATERGILPFFHGWSLRRREPALPEGGRADLLLAKEGGTEAQAETEAQAATEKEVAGGAAGAEHFVEVKAVTHAEDEVGKFPDAPTERGQRHLRDLTALAQKGVPASVVFVAMRPDVTEVRPFRTIDPAFADALEGAAAAGVGVHAVGTAFDPPVWTIVEASLPVRLV